MQFKLFFFLSTAAVIVSLHSFSMKQLKYPLKLAILDTTKSYLFLYGEYILKEKIFSATLFSNQRMQKS